MQKFLIELAILGCFIGLAWLWEYLDHHKPSDHPCKLGCVFKRHFKWLLLIVAHPTVLHGVREFSIHLVIYSGLVFGGH